MKKFRQELDIEITKMNHIAEISNIMICNKKIPLVLCIEDEFNSKLSGIFETNIREKVTAIHFSIYFTSTHWKAVELEVYDDSFDFNEYDLKYIYFEEIQSKLFELQNRKPRIFTIRNYRSIFNSTPIRGIYRIHLSDESKFEFSSISEIDRDEPMTEHVVAFDLVVYDYNLDSARSKVQNIVSDYCGFLSVLLDIGFHDLKSEYRNFLVNNKFRNVVEIKRYRTGFYDDQLKLIVKDNLNGLMHVKDMNKEPLLGYIGYSDLYNQNSYFTEKLGSTPNLEETLNKHRLYKNNKKEKDNRPQNIRKDVHFPNEEIEVPLCIREYFKNIHKLEKENHLFYKCFRNASRMYNLAHLLMGMSPTSAITYLVAAIESISKSENLKFGSFMRKYNPNADHKLMDYLYSKVRSGHIHAGEFSFLEYDIQLNGSFNRSFLEAKTDYLKARQNIREALVTWIDINILSTEPS